ncbi:unnamed protein product [Mytilus coruscus]|uniref:IRS-type PTB domain-containing protein n=1 Tax=Mytilus coruscus TaxID=42192 RepID=A0A6J8A9F4_MYTCO|nr:unnamed protein product [Mytilus coruscus]
MNINSYLLVSFKLPESCKSHSEKYQAYCYEHECSCCTKCLIEEHKNCKELTVINNFISSIKSSNMILEIENSLREVAENLKRIKKNRAENMSSLILDRQRIEIEIQGARDAINEHFDRLQNDVMKELARIEDDKSKQINKIWASVERKEKEIDELQLSLAIIKHHASDLQTFLLSKQIEHELMNTDSLVQSMQENGDLSDVIISLQAEDLVKSINVNNITFGEIIVQRSSCDMSLVRHKHKQAQTNVDVATRNAPKKIYENIEIMEHATDLCFNVVVKPGKDALKFGFKGQYRLYVTKKGFKLEDTKTMTLKYYWPHHIVRQYEKSGQEIVIEVGRRNLLGQGTFSFCVIHEMIDKELCVLYPLFEKD